MFAWVLIILVAAAAACFFVDASKPQAWTARGLFVLSVAIIANLINQVVH